MTSITAPQPSSRALGVVGHGVSTPSTWRYTPERCGDHGHPGHTYNPWQDRTWCLCGAQIVDGNTVNFAHKGRDGLLAEPITAPEGDGRAEQ